MSWRDERKKERQEKALEELERQEAENRARDARSTWQKIYDLDIDDDLKSILWTITEKLDL